MRPQTNFFADGHFKNMFLNSSVAWSATVIGRLCSRIKFTNKHSALMIEFLRSSDEKNLSIFEVTLPNVFFGFKMFLYITPTSVSNFKIRITHCAMSITLFFTRLCQNWKFFWIRINKYLIILLWFSFIHFNILKDDQW